MKRRPVNDYEPQPVQIMDAAGRVREVVPAEEFRARKPAVGRVIKRYGWKLTREGRTEMLRRTRGDDADW